MRNEIPETGSAEELGIVLGVSARRVRQLAAEHSIFAVTRGQYPFQPVIHAYLEQAASGLLSDAERHQRDRVANARAREIEARTARQERELVPTEEVVAFTDAIVDGLMSGLDELPAKVTEDANERARIKGIIDRIRDEVAAVREEHLPAYAAQAATPSE